MRNEFKVIDGGAGRRGPANTDRSEIGFQRIGDVALRLIDKLMEGAHADSTLFGENSQAGVGGFGRAPMPDSCERRAPAERGVA